MGKAIRIQLQRRQRESLERKRRSHPDLAVRRRAAIVLMSAEEWPVADICEAVGVTRMTVTNTRTRWLEYGLRGLADRPRSGRPPVADGEYLAALLDAVNTPPGDLGYAFGVWTSGRLAAHLQRRLGKTLSPQRVRVHLRAMGYVWARPKHTLKGRRDEAEHRKAKMELKRLKRGRNAGTPPTRSSFSTRRDSTSTRTWLGRGVAEVPNSGSRRRARTAGWQRAARTTR
jgi:transposase